MRTSGKILILVMGMTSFFAAGCSDDKETKSAVAAIEAVIFDGQPVVLTQPVVQENGSDINFQVAPDVKDDDLKALVPTITLSEKATVEPASGVAQDFTSGSVMYTVTAEDGVTKRVYSVNCVKNKYENASILSVSFTDAIVSEQPMVPETGAEIVFYVPESAVATDLAALTPTIVVSPGATITPASGTPQDFSEGAVDYTVTSEDGVNRVVYTLMCLKKRVYGFETWKTVGAGKAQRLDVEGWASSNLGLATLKGLGFAGDWTHLPSTDVVSGEKAALIQTISTGGFMSSMAPLITAGSLYLGTFKLDTKNPLNSTKFGEVFTGNPREVKGWFKYTPGTDYYVVTEKGATVGKTKWGVDNSKKDEYSIMAVLYEVATADETLTGTTIATSDKIVARGYQSGGVQTEWTLFRLKLEWKEGKSYNPAQMYKFAIICSSSKDGDAYEGAPGSKLILDDLEVLY